LAGGQTSNGVWRLDIFSRQMNILNLASGEECYGSQGILDRLPGTACLCGLGIGGTDCRRVRSCFLLHKPHLLDPLFEILKASLKTLVQPSTTDEIYDEEGVGLLCDFMTTLSRNRLDIWLMA
jgi:hypothetical protein